MRVTGVEHHFLAVADRRVGFPQSAKLALPSQPRIRPALLGCDIHRRGVWRNRRPRLDTGGREPGVGRGAPWHRGAFAIAPIFLGPAGNADRIAHIFLAGRGGVCSKGPTCGTARFCRLTRPRYLYDK